MGIRGALFISTFAALFLSASAKPLIFSKQTPSTEQQKRSYREALRLVETNYHEAILAMEGFAKDNPESDLADNAIYWIAQLYIQRNEVNLARDELLRLLERYPNSDRVKRARATLAGIMAADSKSPAEPAPEKGQNP